MGTFSRKAIPEMSLKDVEVYIIILSFYHMIIKNNLLLVSSSDIFTFVIKTCLILAFNDCMSEKIKTIFVW